MTPARRSRAAPGAAIACAAAVVVASACSSSGGGGPPADPEPGPFATLAGSGGALLKVSRTGPLSIVVEREGGGTLGTDRGEGPGRAPVSVAVAPADVDPLVYFDAEVDEPAGVVWHGTGELHSLEEGAGRLTAIALLSPGPGSVTLELEPAPGGVAGFTGTATIRGVAGVPVLTRLGLGAGAGPVWGGGEVPGGPDLRGRVTPLALRFDPSMPNASNEHHVPVPLAVRSDGALLFVEDDHPGALDVGAAVPGRLQATFATSGPLRFHLVPGRGVRDALRGYHALAGLPRLPPAWAFAPQQWRNEHRDGAQVLEDARTMRDLGIPGSLIWIDNPWQTGYSTFEFNPEKYPQAAALIDQLNALGYRVIVWTCPYLNSSDDSDLRPGMNRDAQALFADARARGLFVTKGDDGEPFLVPWSWGTGAQVDFSHPEGAALWSSLAGRAVAAGVEGFKLDYGEEVAPDLLGVRVDLRFANGETTDTMHRRSQVGYHRATRAALEAAGKDGFLIGRASTWGGHAVVDAIWPGDLDISYERGGPGVIGGLGAALSGAMSLALSGFPTYGSDVGGYRGPDADLDDELLLRWAAMQAALPVLQLGGGAATHNPWEPPFGPAALEGYRTLARLHLALFPYFRAHAVRAATDGTPYVLPPAAIWPASESLHEVDDAFVLGDALFVAPVRSKGASARRVVLPPGRWARLDATLAVRELVSGPAELDAPAAPGDLPLFLREGAPLPLLPPDVVTVAPATADGVVSLDARRDRLRVLYLPGAGEPLVLEDGGELAPRADGLDVRAAAGVSRVVVELPAEQRPAEIQVDGDPVPFSEADPWACSPACASFDGARAVVGVASGRFALDLR